MENAMRFIPLCATIITPVELKAEHLEFKKRLIVQLKACPKMLLTPPKDNGFHYLQSTVTYQCHATGSERQIVIIHSTVDTKLLLAWLRPFIYLHKNNCLKFLHL